MRRRFLLALSAVIAFACSGNGFLAAQPGSRFQTSAAVHLSPNLPLPNGSAPYNGLPTDIMLEGFHWTWRTPGGPDWYTILKNNAQTIKDAGFDIVWFPPPTATADQQGYMPTEWYNLNTVYGTQDELKAAIAAIRPAKALADIVINHRNGRLTAGADFQNPPFADNAQAVVSNDECHCGSGAPDTGRGDEASRDLDHTNASVQSEIKKWEQWLETDIGFSGWRYDMVVGYAGQYVAEYNDASRPYLSVGEYWDGNRQSVINWIDSTHGKSMAFDFPTRYLLRDALISQDFSKLKTIDGKPTGDIGWWPSMSVTFLENHDTEADNHNDPFPADKALEGYAYILTHPGIPCVFWSDYFDRGEVQKQKIAALIRLRKQAHITSQSTVNIVSADNQKYAAIIDDKVAVKIGPGSWSPGNSWQVVTDGNDYAVWTRN